jgi:CRP/FNR family transcriptional regulator, cyclic AMP receptor protein
MPQTRPETDPPQRHEALLMRGRWFRALPDARRAQLLSQARVRQLPAGVALFLRGDAADGLYAVLSGAVRIGAVAGTDRDALLTLLEPPEWFGEMAFFDRGPRTHDAYAVGATTLMQVPAAALERLLAAEDGWWQHLGALMVEKVRALFVGLEEIAVLPAPARVARRLVAIAQGHGMLAPGVALRTVSVSQEQLGTMLSLTRQTVSGVLSDFESRGWIRRRYRAIELLNVEALLRL